MKIKLKQRFLKIIPLKRKLDYLDHIKYQFSVWNGRGGNDKPLAVLERLNLFADKNTSYQ